MLYYYQIRNISIENLKYFSRAVFLKNKTVHRYYSKLKYLKDQIPEEIHYLVTTYRRNEVVEETSTEKVICYILNLKQDLVLFEPITNIYYT